MAVFLAVFDNQYAKEKQEMLDTTFYKQVTDSKITDAIQTATDEAKKMEDFTGQSSLALTMKMQQI